MTGDRRDRSGRRDDHSSYRERERSPHRERGSYRRDDRDGRSRQHERDHSIFRTDTGSSSYNNRAHERPSEKSAITSLPKEVKLPDTGRRLPQTSHRPKSSATRASVLVNHFRLNSLPEVPIWKYELRFSKPDKVQADKKPEISSVSKLKALHSCADQLGLGSVFVFDGVSIGYSTEKLVDVNEQGTKFINLPGHRDDRPNRLEVTMRNSGQVGIGDLADNFLKSRRCIDQQVNWLGTLLRDDPARRFITRPRGLQFFAREKGLYISLSSTDNILEAIRGFHQSISTHFGALSVNIDTSCSPFYVPDTPMLDIIRKTSRHDLNSADVGQDWSYASDFITGIFVYVIHRGEVGRKKRIRVKGLYHKSAADAYFEQLDRLTGTTKVTSVDQYFLQKYNLHLKYKNIPLLDTPIGLLPPELCFVCAEQRYSRVLEGKETADFIKYATAPAFIRSSQIMESVGRLAWHQQEKVAAHGVSIDTKMMEVAAVRHILPSPRYADGKAAQVNNGAWNIRGMSLTEPSGFKGWGVVYFPPTRGRPTPLPQILDFMKTVQGSLRQHGIRVPTGEPSFLGGNINGDILEVMTNIATKTQNAWSSSPTSTLIFAFVHDGMPADRYKVIKTATEVELGIPCQVLKVEKALGNARGQAQYCANVCLKVNLKCGGVNSVVYEKLLQEQPTLMIGGDVNHPAPSQLRTDNPPPSFFALAGSNDMFASRYSGIASAVPATEEMMTSLEVPGAFPNMVEELVDRFSKRNGGVRPRRVIYWRDGVSESQESALMAGEVRAIKTVLARMGLEDDAKLTVILAVKRHHTRFFPTSRDHAGDRNGNVAPGTIVESGDGAAFVVGHAALQGTVRPTHYKMLLDEAGLSADDLHRLVLHGCYSYGRATRAVHTHAAIYYADQIAQRSRARLRLTDAGATVFRDVHENLRASTMWWQ